MQYAGFRVRVSSFAYPYCIYEVEMGRWKVEHWSVKSGNPDMYIKLSDYPEDIEPLHKLLDSVGLEHRVKDGLITFPPVFDKASIQDMLDKVEVLYLQALKRPKKEPPGTVCSGMLTLTLGELGVTLTAVADNHNTGEVSSLVDFLTRQRGRGQTNPIVMNVPVFFVKKATWI